MNIIVGIDIDKINDILTKYEIPHKIIRNGEVIWIPTLPSENPEEIKLVFDFSIKTNEIYYCANWRFDVDKNEFKLLFKNTENEIINICLREYFENLMF